MHEKVVCVLVCSLAPLLWYLLTGHARETGERFFRCNRQCFGKLDDVFKSAIALPALYSPDVVAMKSGPLSKSFLGQASF